MYIRMTEESVEQAIHFTTEAKTTLANNYTYMRSAVTSCCRSGTTKM